MFEFVHVKSELNNKFHAKVNSRDKSSKFQLQVKTTPETKSILLESIQRCQNPLCTSIINSSSSKTKGGPKNFRYALGGDVKNFHVSATMSEIVLVVFYRNSPHYWGSCCGLRELFKNMIVIMNLRICSTHFWSCSGFFFLRGLDYEFLKC